jgi:hypothetical protein
LGLIAAQMFKRAARFGAHARNAKSDYLRAAYQQLPLRYARLAGERETEEGQVVRKRGAMAAKRVRRWDLICDATRL